MVFLPLKLPAAKPANIATTIPFLDFSRTAASSNSSPFLPQSCTSCVCSLQPLTYYK
jgi:hypothetical protein